MVEAQERPCTVARALSEPKREERPPARMQAGMQPCPCERPGAGVLASGILDHTVRKQRLDQVVQRDGDEEAD